MIPKTVAIVGAGRVGSSIGFLLGRAGYTVKAIASRSMESAHRAAAFIGSGGPTTDVIGAAKEADIVFITTPDGVVRNVCERVAAGRGFKRGSLIVHMSGAHSLELLDSATPAGASRAVIHPLQSVASKEQGIRVLPGSYFRVESDPGALDSVREIVKALGGLELAMPKWSSDGDSAALYHAGAVAVSNYLVALVDYGLEFYQALGSDKNEALKAVLPLVRGTLQNIEALGIPDALTGPIVRGDAGTVRDHLAAMRNRAPGLLGLYRELARQTIRVATDKGGIDRQRAEELLSLLEDEALRPG